MPTKTIGSYMTAIDSASILEEIKNKGLSRTEVAVMLIPQYEFRSDSYRHFRYWIRNGRMPVDRYKMLRRILDGTV